MRVLFTGGSGKAGRHVVPWLVAQGHRVLNVDRVPLEAEGVDNLIADVTDAGQVFSAMRAYADFDELEPGTGTPAWDAVVHFAAVPRILMQPDVETYRTNVIGTYNVLEAACKMGVRKIVIASSETVYGICFSDGQTSPASLPLTEDSDADPMDSYGVSKVANEVTARGFARRFGADIYALRIGNVVEPHEYERDFPGYFADPSLRRRITWSYIDARDLGRIVDLCLGRDGLGFQVFNAGMDDTSACQPTMELVERFFPGVDLTEDLPGRAPLFSNRKIREVLGFEAEFGWEKQVSAPES